MRKLLSVLLVLSMLVSLCVLAVQAENRDDEEEEDVSFYEPTPLPDPNASPAPTPEPGPTQEPVLQADGSTLITVTAVGDVTIGWDVEHERQGSGLFDKELKKQNGDLNFIFRNVKDIFQSDDLTIANFEGVLADETVTVKKKNGKGFRFVGDPSYAAVLSKNGVEAVTMENNHIDDFGQAGIDSTARALENEGVVWANRGHMGYYEAQGVRIGMLAYQIVPPLRSDELSASELQKVVAEDIARAKETCDLVFVSFHWGKELDYAPRNESPYCHITLGHAAIDAGADLVLGHHSHRINPIERYKGRYIVYSLANCSFAGNSKPSDMFTFIFQARFRIKDGQIIGNPFRIIPCRISSRKDYNDFAITPLTDTTNINTVMLTLTNRQNTKNLPDALDEYPMEWED